MTGAVDRLSTWYMIYNPHVRNFHDFSSSRRFNRSGDLISDSVS